MWFHSPLFAVQSFIPGIFHVIYFDVYKYMYFYAQSTHMRRGIFFVIRKCIWSVIILVVRHLQKHKGPAKHRTCKTNLAENSADSTMCTWEPCSWTQAAADGVCRKNRACPCLQLCHFLASKSQFYWSLLQRLPNALIHWSPVSVQIQQHLQMHRAPSMVQSHCESQTVPQSFT